MSTPSVTILKNLVLNWETDQMEEETIATFYRHYDGYPSCHAVDIANSLIVASRTKPEHIDFSGASVERDILNNRNWCQHFLKAMCMADADIEFIGEGALFLWLFGSRHAGGMKARQSGARRSGSVEGGERRVGGSTMGGWLFLAPHGFAGSLRGAVACAPSD